MILHERHPILARHGLRKLACAMGSSTGLAASHTGIRLARIVGDTAELSRQKGRVALRMFGCDSEPVRLGDFELLEHLGHGGMGSVYVAFDPKLERKVAIKRILATGDPAACRRAVQEARALAKVWHPNVVPVHDIGGPDHAPFIVMEFIDGVTVREWLRLGPRTTAEILAVFVAAGHGLAAVHAAGLVHRDFKPENVMIRHGGQVLLIDFGLACVTDRSGSSEVLVGTAPYMAPEQWRGADVDARADQYGFCVALHEALLGACDAERAGDPASQPKPAVSEQWLDVIRRGWAGEPGQRHPSMDALLAALTKQASTQRSATVHRVEVGILVVLIIALAWMISFFWFFPWLQSGP